MKQQERWNNTAKTGYNQRKRKGNGLKWQQQWKQTKKIDHKNLNFIFRDSS